MPTQEPSLSASPEGIDPLQALASIKDKAVFYPGRQAAKNLELLQHLSRYSGLMLTITGPSGTGKTHLMHHLIKKLDSGVRHIQLDAKQTPDTARLLAQIESALQLDILPSADIPFILNEIRDFTQRLNDEGNSCFILIDQAEALEDETLDRLLDLASTANEQQRPHIALFGQDALIQRLQQQDFQARFEAIGHHIELSPFSEVEARGYLEHRCHSVGLEALPLNDKSFTRVYQLSHGIPAALNQALISELQGRPTTPDEKEVSPKMAASKSESPPEKKKSAKKGGLGLKTLLGAAVIAAIAAGLAVAFLNRDAMVSSSPSPDMSIISRSQQVRQEAWQSNQPAQPPEQTQAEEATPPARIPAEPEPEPEPEPTLDQLDDAPPSESTPTPVIAEPAPPRFTDQGQRREAWLMERNPSRYTLQMMGSLEEASAINFIQQQRTPERFVYFEGRHQSRPWFVVVYGDYANREAALAAVSTLPEALRNQRPWARSFESVQNDLNNR